MTRLDDLKRFYSLLDELETRLGGKHTLEQCSGRMRWPSRGVYFFFEPGEFRIHSGNGMRVVRVGTHALTASSRSTLWGRLSQHRGVGRDGGGNHRGSIFRLLVGQALLRHSGETTGLPSWGMGSDPGKAARELGTAREAVKEQEHSHEVAVSRHIRAMPFLWLAIEDAPGPGSVRGLIERNAIGLLSNYRKEPLDAPSSTWLGHKSGRERVRESGLWNNNHVDEPYEPTFLDTLASCVSRIGPQ
jgi:hypothetical protein